MWITAFLGLRSEWAKCHARAARWSEEVSLLVEEMRRVLWFAHWKVNWWGCQANLRQDQREDIQEGLAAYAAKQAAIWEEMGSRFSAEWYPLLRGNGLSTEWPEEYLERWASLDLSKEVQGQGRDAEMEDGDSDDSDD